MTATHTYITSTHANTCNHSLLAGIMLTEIHILWSHTHTMFCSLCNGTFFSNHIEICNFIDGNTPTKSNGTKSGEKNGTKGQGERKQIAKSFGSFDEWNIVQWLAIRYWCSAATIPIYSCAHVCDNWTTIPRCSFCSSNYTINCWDVRQYLSHKSLGVTKSIQPKHFNVNVRRAQQ